MLLPKPRKTMHNKTKEDKTMKGIYQYRDLNTDEIVYIGKDSHIENNARDRAHKNPSKYTHQPFNSVLQNNPDRYQYEIIYAGVFDDDLLNTLEINSIAEENPKFNFTKGGDGISGYNHSEETKRKIGEASKGRKHSEETKRKLREVNKGEKNPNYGKHPTLETRKKISKANSGKNHPNYGKHLPKETRSKISESHKGMYHSEEAKRKVSEANKYKIVSEETKRKISEAQKGEKSNHWKDYARIIHAGFTGYGKQNYAVRFQGKQIKYSIYPEKLKKWFNENYPDEKLIIEGDIIAE